MMKGLLKSFCDACRGLLLGLSSGRNVALSLLAVVVVTVVGVWQDFQSWQWAVVILCFMIVIALELVNTVVEKLCDLIEPRKSNKVRFIKDVTAGAVLWACIGAAIIFFIILGDVLQ